MKPTGCPARFGRDPYERDESVACSLAAIVAAAVTTRGGPAARLRRIERGIEARATECGVVVDPTSGTPKLVAAGSRASVSFPRSTGPKFKDAVFTHNHPRGSAISDTDLILALEADVRELRAVGFDASGRRRTYRLLRPRDGWPALAAVERVLEGVDREVDEENRRAVCAGELSREQAGLRRSHMVLSRAAAALGLDYRVGG